MFKKIAWLICVGLALCLLNACSSQQWDEQTAETNADTKSQSKDISGIEYDGLHPGLYIPVEGLPEIDEFPSSFFQERKAQFLDISSVRYIAEGSSLELPTDDSRVIRLLNFIGKSFEDGTYGMQFGYEEPNEIAGWYENTAPMLGITFRDNKETADPTGFALCSALLIRGGTVLKVLNPEYTNDSMTHGVLLWPYNTLLGENSLQYLCYPEKEQWIDLLVYAGFSR